MAAIIGFESRLSGEGFVFPRPLAHLSIAASYGHVAYEDNNGQIYGFSPDPIPEVIDPFAKYPGCYANQTQLLSLIKGYIKIERFPIEMSWYEETFVYVRTRGNERSTYCVKAPIRGPPYNCISYLREVVGVGDFPKTNLLAEVFDVLRRRR